VFAEAVVSEYVHRRPAPALRSLVDAYDGYRDVGGPPALHRGLPSPSITLIVTLDEPLTMLDGPVGSRRDFDTLIGGLHTTPSFIHHDGRQSGIQVSLKPLGARALLGMPGGELTRIDVPAADVLGRGIDLLRRRLHEATTWEQRFALVDEALTARIVDGRRPAPEICRAWDVLISSQGRTSVEAISREVGWSTRHLRARFEVETGLSPKSLARVMRFDRARRMLRPRVAGATACLADIAAACGYADQSHLTRDFGQLAGLSPTAWLRSEMRPEFRSVQDIDPDQRAPSPV
jgi:AraC-like DNA-binding protein